MAEPTIKAGGIETFLSGLAGTSRVAAIQRDRCLFCKGPADSFIDEVSRREYAICGMCQTCQDDFYSGEDG